MHDWRELRSAVSGVAKLQACLHSCTDLFMEARSILMSQADEKLVADAVRHYIVAMSTAAETDLRAAFHPSASIIGNYGGVVEWLTVDGYVGEVMAASLPPNDSPDWELLSLDVTEDAAVAKVEEAFGGMTFTDYLSLLKIAGEWKIVNKLYHLHA